MAKWPAKIRSRGVLAALTGFGLLLSGLTAPTATAGSVPPEVIGTGETRNCLYTPRIKSTRVVDDRTVLFFTMGRAVYRNVLANRCATLDFHEAFLYRTHGTQLCDTDMIEVYTGHRGADGPSCSLGKFERVEIVKPQGRAAMR